MKIETILDAYEIAILEAFEWIDNTEMRFQIKNRQATAFRDRIIRMDERNKMEIGRLRNYILFGIPYPTDLKDDVTTDAG